MTCPDDHAVTETPWWRVVERSGGRERVRYEFVKREDAEAFVLYLKWAERGNVYWVKSHPHMPRPTFTELLARMGIDEKEAIRKWQTRRRRQLRE